MFRSPSSHSHQSSVTLRRCCACRPSAASRRCSSPRSLSTAAWWVEGQRTRWLEVGEHASSTTRRAPYMPSAHNALQGAKPCGMHTAESALLSGMAQPPRLCLYCLCPSMLLLPVGHARLTTAAGQSCTPHHHCRTSYMPHHSGCPDLNLLLAAGRQLLLGVHRCCKGGGIAQHPELPQHHWHTIVCTGGGAEQRASGVRGQRVSAGPAVPSGRGRAKGGAEQREGQSRPAGG